MRQPHRSSGSLRIVSTARQPHTQLAHKPAKPAESTTDVDDEVVVRLVSALSEPAFVMDTDGCVIAGNSQFASLLGKDLLGLIGTSVLKLVERKPGATGDSLVAILQESDFVHPVSLTARTSEQGDPIELRSVRLSDAGPGRSTKWFVRVQRHGTLADRLRRLADANGDGGASLEAEHLALAREIETLERAATIDGLTGLANRARFDADFDRMMAQSRRDGRPLALVLFDVDDFKQLNDTFGHPEGDRCLRHIASILRGAARRPLDVAARVGGEEFALLLPSCSESNALRLATSICRGVEAAEIAHPLGTVTMSAGLAAIHPGSGTALDTAGLYAAADRALYGAKRRGKNRVWTSPSL